MTSIYERVVASARSFRNPGLIAPPPSPGNTNSPTGGRNPRDTQSNHQLTSLLTSIYSVALKTKDDYIDNIDAIEGHYLVDALLTNISEDALTPDIYSGEILQISSPNEEVNKELAKFQSQFSIDDIINDFIIDFLKYGEYSLRLTVTPGQGVTKIHDEGYDKGLIALYSEGYPVKFLKLSDEKNQPELHLYNAYNYAHFMLGPRKISVKIDLKHFDRVDKDLKILLKNLRIGKPIFYGVISKLKELMLLEQLVPALKLADINKSSIIGVEVPQTTAPEDAFKITRRYEDLFNQKLAIDSTNKNLSVTDIISTAGRLKVIPTFSGKGSVTPIDVRSDSNISEITASINENRDIISTSVGFPTELLYGGANKTEILKKYARYLRKIKSIQSAISRGVIHIALSHINNKSGLPSIKPSDIEVTFKNEVVNIDELEKLEYQDAIISITKNVVSFVKDLVEDENTTEVIDKESYVKWLKGQLAFIPNDNGITMSTVGGVNG